MRLIKYPLALLLASATPSFASVMPLDQAAKLFGARPSTFAADLSPSGNKVVFLSADGGAKTSVKVLNLLTDQTSRVFTSNGKPERLSWCEFATETKIVCRYGGNVKYERVIVYVGRLISFDLEQKQLKQLGVRETERDLGMRQDDGAILDWLTDEAEGSVLMARQHVEQAGSTGSNLSAASAGGLGVDWINLATMRVSQIEAPRPNVSSYMTDGRGTVRLKGTDVFKGEQLTGTTKFSYRTTGSKA